MAISKSRLRIKRGIRSKISGSTERPRITVFKSNARISAQIVDDSKGYTLVTATSVELSDKKNADIELSKEVGRKLAEKAIAEGITNVVFDRNGYVYHGKVKALAEGAREGGLKF
ncbi:MAG: large subunit ribosomal protein L18 [Roseivirga sp.]|jgi:large subunit ribosomal protein L18